jgi:hypothetical protein
MEGLCEKEDEIEIMFNLRVFISSVYFGEYLKCKVYTISSFIFI